MAAEFDKSGDRKLHLGNKGRIRVAWDLALLAVSIGLFTLYLNRDQILSFVGQRTDVHGTISLDKYSCGVNVPNYASEQRMFQLVNQERVAFGLLPLQWNEKLAEQARRHSGDMWQRSYFDHINPEGKSPFNRLAAAGIFFSYAGENLALTYNVERAHEGLMKSPGHRMNILDPRFEYLGVGAIPCGAYEIFAQEFTGYTHPITKLDFIVLLESNLP